MSRSYPLYNELLKSVPDIKQYFQTEEIDFDQKGLPLLKFSLIQFPTKPLIIIMAGIHGEESAPPLTIFQHYTDFYRLATKNKINLIIYPLVNPWGFDNNQRYTQENLNCADNWVHKIEGKTANNVQYLKKELTNDIKNTNTDIIFIDLHEDIDTQSEFFLYSFGARTFETPILETAQKFFPLTENSHNNLTGLKNGVIYEEHDGSAEDFMSHQKGVIFSCCTETPLHQSLTSRVNCNHSIIETIIKFTAIQQS